ncbi:NAD(P)-dependent oxidoreductase [Crateriforma conspicua]|uniref:NAD(P)-dependent oxidoreductase n=1 Tax=Crateriforma conspicua TaxID=2527996 RepID=UPI001189AEBF|nr:2-hydroxy-3-oxopropionate reductase [Crateriforma conspicua]
MSVNAIEPGKTRIGWIGTGVMGASMCGHLIDAGFSATVFNRTRSKAEALIERGATWADSPRAVAETSDVIFTIVGFPHDVRSVILDEDTGVLAGCDSGNIIVDMTTSQPSLAVEIAQAAAKRDVLALDAPVSGGDKGAKKGTLSIMIGGDAGAVAALQPCWDAMGKTVVHQGDAGSGQHTKMVNQILISTGMIGVCEALIYGHRAGLDLPTVLKSVGSGAAGSWSLSNLGPRIIDNNFDPGFFVEHFIKDMGIALAESRRMGLSMPGLALAQQLYQAVAAQGHAKDGTHALALALSSLNGFDWKTRN